MLNLENKDYDLNTLFSFEVLKEILLKLAKAQINQENAINNIINSNKERDRLIAQLLNKKGDVTAGDIDFTIPNQNLIETDDEFDLFDETKIPNTNYDEKEIKQDQKSDIIHSQIIENKGNNINSELKEDEINQLDQVDQNIEQNLKNLSETNNEENNNNINNEKIDNNKINETENKNINTNDNKNIDNNKNNIQTNEKNIQNNQTTTDNINKDPLNPKNYQIIKNYKQIPIELVKSMLKTIKENRLKICVLEKQIKTQISQEIDTLKKDYTDQLKSHETENSTDINNINNKINEINDKLENHFEKKLEEVLLQASKFDIMDLIKDSGDGTIDATKLMVKALEDKVFKKIEFVETRFNKNESEGLITKKKLDVIMPQFKKTINDIERLYNVTDNQKNLIEKNKFDIINNKKELDEKLEKMKEKILKKINNQLENTKKENNEKFNSINEKLKEMKKNEGNELFHLGLGIDKETIDDINKKIGDLRKKINDVDNSLQLHLLDSEKAVMKSDIKEIKSILETKISTNNLKDLYNLHLSDLDEINDLKDVIHKINNESKKQKDKIDNIAKSILLSQTNMGDNKNNNSSIKMPIFDFTKFVDQTKLTDTLRPILKELDSILKEVESLRRNLTDDEEEIQKLKEDLNIEKIKEEINNKINDIKTLLHKKYIEKNEYNKTIKNIENKIFLLNEENNKRKDGENWLLAKKNLNCFNCATCEGNLKNENPQREYSHWNKYPPTEKIYRMGQGFSHMLQMMTSEFVKSIERNTRENNNLNNENILINDINNNDGKLINFMNNMNNESGKFNTNPNENLTFGLKINNRDQSIDENLFKVKSGKTRLPMVSKFGKKNKYNLEDTIPVSDDEKEKNEISAKMKYTPKIMKIMKKRNLAESFAGTNEGISGRNMDSIKYNPPTNLKMYNANSQSVNNGVNN